jgi:hypothetical protein
MQPVTASCTCARVTDSALVSTKPGQLHSAAGQVTAGAANRGCLLWLSASFWSRSAFCAGYERRGERADVGFPAAL